METISAGDLDEVQRCLDDGARVNALVMWDGDLISPLTWAVLERQRAVVAYLFEEAGADPYLPSTSHGTTLHAAAFYDDEATIELLLAAGMPVDVPESVDGSSPLAQACAGSSLGAIRLLVETYRADVQAVDDNGKSVLLHAGLRDAEVLAYLVAQGVLPDRCDERGRVLVHEAVSWYSVEPAIACLRYLHSRGVDMNAKNEQGLTPLETLEKKREGKQKELDTLDRLIAARAKYGGR